VPDGVHVARDQVVVVAECRIGPGHTAPAAVEVGVLIDVAIEQILLFGGLIIAADAIDVVIRPALERAFERLVELRLARWRP
jgi:hypothetical protein